MYGSILQSPHNIYHYHYIIRIFCIPNLIKPKQIVTSFILILHFSKISSHTFRRVIEFIVFSCMWIGKLEKIVLVLAYWWTKPSGLQYSLSQYHFGIYNSVSYDFFIKVGDGQFRKIVFCLIFILYCILQLCFQRGFSVTISAVSFWFILIVWPDY